MNSLARIVFVLVATQLAFSMADCTTYSNCTTCVADLTCGWCDATQQCLAGNINGPNASLCLVSWNYKQCPTCQVFETCRECHHMPSCMWCGNSSSCIPRVAGATQCGPMTHTCPAPDIDTCSACVWEGYFWCPLEGKCVTNATGLKCLNQLSQCTCETISSCEECLNTPGCELCGQPWSCFNATAGTHQCTLTNTVNSCSSACALYNGNCGECNAHSDCTFCAYDSTCDAKETSGCPSVQTCPEACHKITDCHSCIYAEECFWTNKNGGSCMSPLDSDFHKHTYFSTCDFFCEKEGGTTCETCAGYLHLGCIFNEEEQVCRDVVDARANDNFIDGTWYTTCPSDMPHHFDAGSFVGGMFLVIGVALLVYFAVACYKKGGRPVYQNLN